MIKDKMQAVKNHIVRNKEVYISAGSGMLVGAGFTFLITRGRHAENAMRSEIHDGVVMRPLSFLSKQSNTVVAVFEREGRGHPGYLTHCLETDEIFTSQHQAADSMNIPRTVLSWHLRGKFPDANGFHFQRLAVA